MCVLDPDYCSPMFLDCCGLVRRCLWDLSDDFGFKLGGGNQGYQYDTLPIRKASHHELEHGDLIFYSATYHNPRMKRPPHDMVHVEIFIGGETGEATIGMRWAISLISPSSSLPHDVLTSL
jgi:hypothetical protein